MEKSNIKWTDVVGLENAKNSLEKAILMRRESCKGILLNGPRGSGKTYLSRAISDKLDLTFIYVNLSALLLTKLDKSVEIITNLFNLARENKPSVLFFDEIDSLCAGNDVTECAKDELLNQMNNNRDNLVALLAATNNFRLLDSTIRMFFRTVIDVPLPNKMACEELLKLNLRNINHDINEYDFQELAQKLLGYSISDIECVVKEAVMRPIDRIKTATHYKRINGSTSNELLTPCASSDVGAMTITWNNIPGDKLLKPQVTKIDILQSIANLRVFRKW